MQVEDHLWSIDGKVLCYEVHVPTRAAGLKSSNYSELIRAHYYTTPGSFAFSA
jgi:hypothetical protein